MRYQNFVTQPLIQPNIEQTQGIRWSINVQSSHPGRIGLPLTQSLPMCLNGSVVTLQSTLIILDKHGSDGNHKQQCDENCSSKSKCHQVVEEFSTDQCHQHCYHTSTRINARYAPDRSTTTNSINNSISTALVLKSSLRLSVSSNLGTAAGLTGFWDMPSRTPMI